MYSSRPSSSGFLFGFFENGHSEVCDVCIDIDIENCFNLKQIGKDTYNFK